MSTGKRQSDAQPDAAITVKKARLTEPSESLKARVRESLQGMGIGDSFLGCPIPASLCCPITTAFIENPVMATDGYTYERTHIERWFMSKSTSPMKNVVIAKDLTTNQNIKASIDEYVTERARELQRSEQNLEVSPLALDATFQGTKDMGPVKSLAELAGMFAKLDGMRDLLAETLKDWGPPKIVVVGSESSGKSSVLERLMMTPLLPRDQEMCTRLPIHIYLRRSKIHEAPVLEVYDTKQKKTVSSQTMTAEQGAKDVSDEMKKILLELNEEEGVTGDKIIKIHIKSPNVPCLDLIDMPGLVVSGNSEALRAKLPDKTKKLVTDHIQSADGKNSLYLAILKSTQQPNSAEAMKIVDEFQLSSKTFGVFTHCDELAAPGLARKLKEWVLDPSKKHGQGKVLEPYGWVATTNVPAENCNTNFERLQSQAQAEVGIFKKLGFDDLLTQGLASHGALVSRLNTAFVRHLKTTWVPNTLQRICEEQGKLEFENAKLGMPPAHMDEREAQAAVRNVIAQAVKKGLDTGIPLLADKYAKSVLLNMQEDIHVTVQTAIIDSIPESWSPASDSVILSRQQETRICSWVAAQKKHPVKLQLLYRASRDGWKGMDFHSRCDNKGATITVIKRTDQSGNVLGKIFGGYADVAWNSNGVVTDPSAFLFSMSAGSVGSTELRVGDRVQLMRDKQNFYGSTIHDLQAGETGIIEHIRLNSIRQNSEEISVRQNFDVLVNSQWYPVSFLESVAYCGAPFKMALSNHLLHCSPAYGPTFGAGGQILLLVAADANANTKSYTNIAMDQLPLGVTTGAESIGPLNFEAAEIEVFQVVVSDVTPFSFVVPPGSFNQVFKLAPDMDGPLMHLCDRYLQHNTSFWADSVKELLPTDTTVPPKYSSHGAVDEFLRNPPLLLFERFGGKNNVIAKLTDENEAFRQQEVHTQIRAAVSGFAKRFNSEVASIDAWPKILTQDGVVVDVVKTDRVTSLKNDIVLSFLRYNTDMLESLLQRVDTLVGQATLIENCASNRQDILQKIVQLERARDGIIELLCEHAQGKEESNHADLVCRVGTCCVVIKTLPELSTPSAQYAEISRGSVVTVYRVGSCGELFLRYGSPAREGLAAKNQVGSFYVLTHD
mmetsp:Transcript_16272/g.26062  ORF Transcript_16272/g.26062 Transcript_16272/m.26062 type:complete len:1119 (-) Transcript_16272:383-3739(-)|eukprot:CAMPEP_0179434832 /NCGR_PEP_ID=MMETSP0799-20121207/19074_1 /TAXON_ID=46947 /ORGANISM="Geminigera cryophila, Strain CCMP2564" /LENGTH=1118 /DNA_ID=CAMNT_0021213861 /DNA_START=258 /DNA_END=3614 /DNA_ORIENTATION=-